MFFVAHATAHASLEDLIIERSFSVTYRYTSICKVCHGTGADRTRVRARTTCIICEGEGNVLLNETLTVPLQPGDIDTIGTTYTIRGKGNNHDLFSDDDGSRGSLQVTLTVAPHPIFRAEGKNLVCHIPVTDEQTRHGDTFTLPTIGGEIKKSMTPQVDQEFRLPREGGYRKGDPVRGDIIYRFVAAQGRQARDASTPVKDEVSEDEKTLSLSAVASLASDLLPSIDSLEKALAAMDNPSDEAHRQGIAMILDMQRQTLAQHGVEIVPALGKTFDPHVHEAVAMDPHSDLPRNTVSEVLQTGYRHNGKLLRPAMVRVSG